MLLKKDKIWRGFVLPKGCRFPIRGWEGGEAMVVKFNSDIYIVLSWHATSIFFIILIKLLATLVFFIHHLTIKTILREEFKIEDQIDTFERSEAIG